MTTLPPGWRPEAPSAPTDTNGWGRHVAATLEHILVRLHYLEKSHDELKSLTSHATDAPTTKPPSEKEIWAERTAAAKEVGTGLKWLAAILLIVGLAFKKIDPSQLPALKSWFGLGV